MVEAHFAVPAAGALLVCINIRQSPGEVARLLEHAEPKVVLVDAEYEALLSSFDTSAVEVVRIADTGAPDDPYERPRGVGLARAPPGRAARRGGRLAINYTSGTTGDPKGVVYTHRGAYLNALANVIEAGLTPRSRLLLVAPLFHCNGWCFPWGAVAVGATIVCLRRADPGRDVAVDRRGGRHQLQQRPHGPDRAGQPRRRAPRARRAHRQHGRLSALTHPARPPPRAEHHARTTSTA